VHGKELPRMKIHKLVDDECLTSSYGCIKGVASFYKENNKEPHVSIFPRMA
jgi:hypothetical protein